jgi:chemotaxis signal transduction protein
MKELLLFQVGKMTFGVDLPVVKNIQSAKTIIFDQIGDDTPFIWQINGKETPLYNLLSIFEKKIIPRYFGNEKLIIVEAESQAVGLIVSSVDHVVAAEYNRIVPLPPIFEDLALSCFSGVLKHESSLVLLLSPRGIVKAVQRKIEPQICEVTSEDENALREMRGEFFCPGLGETEVQKTRLDRGTA